MSLSYVIAETGIFQQVFIRPNHFLMRSLAKVVGFCALLLTCLNSYAVSQITITADRIEHPQFDAQQTKLNIKLNKSPALELITQIKAHSTEISKEKPEDNYEERSKEKSDKDWATFKLGCTLPANRSEERRVGKEC